MREKSIVADKVVIRKPTEDEQRMGKIVTSDYLISALTIHTSILSKLGFVNKIYRSKQVIIIPSNKKKVKSMREVLHKLDKKIGIQPLNKIQCSPKTQSEKRWVTLSNEEIFEGLSEYKYSTMTFHDFLPIALNYLDNIETDAVTKHTQTHVWETAYKHQCQLEKELGENFKPKDLAICKLPNSILKNIENEWGINLLEWEKGWKELCDYLYSPQIINKIRENIGVKVRPRCSEDTRKGTDVEDKKRFKKIIEDKKAILGCDFNLDFEKAKLKEAKKKYKLAENEYEEAKLVVKHATANKSKNIMKLKDACKKVRQKFINTRKNYNELCKSFSKKETAMKIIRKYEIKEKMLDEFMNETRKGEEISALEQEEIINSIRKQKAEQEIPYYTWRFVCDKIDKETASKIEEALEENLNKGNGVNGEDGYINVTSFPMTKSYEFFVDYPKNSNLFRAFKNKGIELSNILIEGVANHLNKKLVNCQGETYFNNPMNKTLSGDMLEWVGL